MSAGSLPGHTYHRASQLGSGTFGSVVVVYNDEGFEFALKLFNNDDEGDHSDADSYRPPGALNIGVLREISALRLLREYSGHVNIVQLVDVQTDWDDEEDGGAGTGGCLSIALPLYKSGSLQDAIKKGFFRSYPRKVKVAVAHGILSAVTYLHDNRIFHRDIKPDNIMLCEDDDNEWRPVLIDFSLAKQIPENSSKDNEPIEHTGEIGTPVYVAPECIEREPYGTASDVWSVGVVLLELLRDQPLAATKDRQAFAMIETTLEQLDKNQPFPNLLRSLLQVDQNKRSTSRQALSHALFTEKFAFPVPEVQQIDVALALPLEIPDDEENESPNALKTKKRRLDARRQRIGKVCAYLNVTHPYTALAAMEYSRVLEQLDDTLDEPNSLGVLHCVILSHRFHELEVLDLDELDEADKGPFADWSLETYVDEESTLFMMLDYCLYPRKPFAC